MHTARYSVKFLKVGPRKKHVYSVARNLELCTGKPTLFRSSFNVLSVHAIINVTVVGGRVACIQVLMLL